MNKSLAKLYKLMQENPDLPVLPMVDGEVVGNDYDNWQGVWGDVDIDSYIEEDECLYLYSDFIDDMETVLNNVLSETDWCWEPIENVTREFNNLPWEKVIFVYIEPIEN